MKTNNEIIKQQELAGENYALKQILHRKKVEQGEIMEVEGF